MDPAPLHRSPAERWIVRVAFVAGVALAVAAVASWRVDAAPGSSRVDVRMSVNLTGELAVAPTGTVLFGRAMEAGTSRGSVRGRFSIRNQTPLPQAVRLRTRASSHGLDDLLWVEASSGGRRLFSGPLGELRRGSRRAIRVEPGGRRTVRLHAWLPARARAGYTEDREDIDLELPSRSIVRR